MFLPGQVVANGAYQLTRHIGTGTGGQVWLALQVRDRSQVAIKVAPASDPEAQERIYRETQLTRQLKHPHLLSAVATIQTHAELVLVFPYAAGGSLRQRLDRERQLPVQQALVVAADVAECLGRLHRRGLVHRDVHPGNILFNGENDAKLSDLGLVQSPRFNDRLWSKPPRGGGRHPGNPFYQPPEVCAEPDQPLRPLTPAADVYMLGAVLWEMLTGQPYHEHKGMPPSRLRAAVPDWLDALVTRCLSDDPAVRPQDGEKLARLLRQEKATESGRRPWPAVVGSSILALAIIGAWWTSGRFSRAPSGAATPAAQAQVTAAGTFSASTTANSLPTASATPGATLVPSPSAPSGTIAATPTGTPALPPPEPGTAARPPALTSVSPILTPGPAQTPPLDQSPPAIAAPGTPAATLRPTATLTAAAAMTPTATTGPTGTRLPETSTSAYTRTPAPAPATAPLAQATPTLSTTVASPTPGPTATLTATTALTAATVPAVAILLEPAAGETASAGKLTTFRWRWEGELAPGWSFEIRIWQSGDPGSLGAFDALELRSLIQRSEDEYSANIDVGAAESVRLHGGGDYFWSVAVVQVEPTYARIGPEAPPFKVRCETPVGQ